MKTRPVGLFVVRRPSDGRWWDGFDRRSKRDRWERGIGAACMWTRRAAAERVAAKVGGVVLQLALVESVS